MSAISIMSGPFAAFLVLGLAVLACLYLSAPDGERATAPEQVDPVGEARQVLEALSHLRQQRGWPPIDVDADLHDLYAQAPRPGRAPPT